MTSQLTPRSLIINSPYERPIKYWDEGGGKLKLTEGRRPAGYEIYDTRTNTKRVEPLDTVNQIRTRVDEWRDSGYEGATNISKQLLAFWQEKGEWESTETRWIGGPRINPFYFCQLEAIETLIWWVEALPTYKQGIHLQGDGGSWERICNKMATGSGKTTLMAMIITWQTLNAVSNPKDMRYSKTVFIVAPGLTVKSRLQVLYPSHDKNVYDEFNLCPNESLRTKLNQVDLLIENWHTLMPLKEQDRSVVKKGKESDKAFVKRVLGKLADAKDIIVLNDEAHHAYRQKAEMKVSKKDAEEFGIDLDEATRWIEGLDRIHKILRIKRCFDLSATPFAPTGKSNTEKGLFEWIISDFGLNDAIESGLVKTPRVVVRDDALPNAQSFRSKLYHLYREDEVSEDLNRKAEHHEPLPDLVQKAYTLLTYDWQETAKNWREAGHTIPPTMLTVCNRTETAARIEYFFNQGDCLIQGTQAPSQTLRVDSRVLDKAERGESVTTKDKNYTERLEAVIQNSGLPSDRIEELLTLKQEEQLRELVDTVGKRGQAGQNIKNVISVAMLSEGWDAANVTHIMGLRAFTSQLLCEQVIGRGLRRVAHDLDENGLFIPEYVNIFGVPLSIFQDIGGEGGATPPPPKPSTRIEVESGRNHLEIKWPNVLRIETVLKKQLVMDWNEVPAVTLDPMNTPLNAEIAPSLTGSPNLAMISEINLENALEEFRLQHLIFKSASKLIKQSGAGAGIELQYRTVQFIGIVEKFLSSNKIDIPSLWHQDLKRKTLLFALNIDAVVTHLGRYIQEQNVEKLAAIFDESHPIGSTAQMRPWLTTRPCHPTLKSQISHVVYDGTWEKVAADLCEKMNEVSAWVKNDHLGFVVRYLWRGSVRSYVPDYFIRLENGKCLILEIKGQDSEQNRAKRAAMQIWVDAVNEQGGFGEWCFDVVFDPAKIRDTILIHC